MTQSNPLSSVSSKARGVSGRVFVFGFLPLIAIVGLAMFSVALRFQSIMKNLELVRAAWPSVAVDLKLRYDKFDKFILADMPSDFPRQEWSEIKQEFEVSNQFDRQSKVIPKMESMIAKSTGDPVWERKDFENERFERFRAAEENRQRIQNDWLGNLTIQALRLRLPPRIDVPLP